MGLWNAGQVLLRLFLPSHTYPSPTCHDHSSRTLPQRRSWEPQQRVPAGRAVAAARPAQLVAPARLRVLAAAAAMC